MASGGIYGIATSALMANQYALDLTSQNIANVNTPGYSRQSPIFVERMVNPFANGVDITGKQRMYDSFLEIDVRQAAGLVNQAEIYYTYAVQVDDLLSNIDSNINLEIADFFTSMQSANSDPANILNREVLYSQTGTLTSRFVRIAEEIQSKYADVDAIATGMVDQVNGYLEAIHAINIQTENKTSGIESLLDKRKELLESLSQLIDFNVLEKDNNTVDLFVGTGDSLLTGGEVSHLKVARNSGDLQRLEVNLEKGSILTEISRFVKGGQLGGLLTYRSEVLDTSRNELGRVAIALAGQMNDQNQLGMDLNNRLGERIFNDINDVNLQAARAISNQKNTGNGYIEVSIDDISLLTSSDYELYVTGGNAYTLMRAKDGVMVDSGTIGGLPDTISADGITLHLQSGTFNNGDRFLITPTRQGASSLSFDLIGPESFALASPIRATPDGANTGSATISEGKVVDVSTPDFATPGTLTPPIAIEFLSANTYQIVNATTSAVIEGPIVYNPAVNNEVFPTPGTYDPGYRFTLSGDARTGDRFDIVYNTDGVSDNRNGRELANIQDRQILNGNTSSIKQAYNQMANTIANKTHFALINQQANDMVYQQALDRRDALSGVNLDEEAVNLMQYQQAYQASAQLVLVANRMFDSLLMIIGA